MYNICYHKILKSVIVKVFCTISQENIQIKYTLFSLRIHRAANKNPLCYVSHYRLSIVVLAHRSSSPLLPPNHSTAYGYNCHQMINHGQTSVLLNLTDYNNYK